MVLAALQLAPVLSWEIPETVWTWTRPVVERLFIADPVYTDMQTVGYLMEIDGILVVTGFYVPDKKAHVQVVTLIVRYPQTATRHDIEVQAQEIQHHLVQAYGDPIQIPKGLCWDFPDLFIIHAVTTDATDHLVHLVQYIRR